VADGTRSVPATVIVRTVADRQVIVAASSEAREHGIRCGMTLTQARALYAGVAHAGHEPQRDRQALEALARWMMRFSPVVSCVCDEHSDCLLLDITGCQRVFGSTETIVVRASQALGQLGISAQLAVAPTPGSAWALAYAGKDGAIVGIDQLESALTTLPPEALRIDDELAGTLRHLGLCTIGQVMRLPRQVLPARFGPLLLKRIDQALGRIAEPLVAIKYQEKIQAQMDFDGAVGSLEAIWLVFKDLIGQVIEQLAKRGQGARQLEVELLRAYAPSVKKTILLSRPSRDPVNMFNLFRCALEELELPFRKGFLPMVNDEEGTKGQRDRGTKWKTMRSYPLFLCPSVPLSLVSSSFEFRHSLRRVLRIQEDGFCGLRITVPLSQKLAAEQVALLEHESYAGQAELDRLIERLRVRLGNAAIVQAELVESYVPEEAWENSNDENRMTNQIRSTNVQMTKRNRALADSSFDHSNLIRHSSFEFRHSPLHLLPHPLEVRVMVTPSEDAEGTPAAFTQDGISRRVAHWVGPERIAGRWWNGHDKTRDYFDVADPEGNRFWIFRVLQTGKWYLHGSFE
jgi:nucleotidyltransferase/DNA polymerase involved in DNA repair